MSERVAIVTGAGGDIGGACARSLARTHDLVLCVDRDGERAAATAGKIGDRARVLVADAADAGFATAISGAAARLGVTAAVVHALAHEEHCAADALSRESLELSLALGPVAAFTLFRELRASGRLGPGAALTVIGSLHASLPFPRTLGYNAAHAALTQVVRTLAHEWAGQGVRVNAVVPGWISTRGEADLYGQGYLDSVASRLPMGRMGTADDVAAAVRFLSSDDASYVSGTFLTVDGALAVSLARLPEGGHE
jgi:NAD(P)-dependent dehydrogenase (short-subunit alcohol dehydrogenase family)